MRKEEIKTQKELLDYIMSKYEEISYFTPYELEHIRDGIEDWVEDNFDDFIEDDSCDIDIIAEHLIRADFNDYRGYIGSY